MSFTQNTTPTLAKQPRKGLVQIANADASNNKTVVTAGANGSKVMALYATSNDSSNRDIQAAIVRSATNYPISTTTVATNSGFVAGAPSVALFPAGLPVDNDNQPYIFLESGDTLIVNARTTVTSTTVVCVHADYVDF